MAKTKRFIVNPGWIFSNTGDPIHYISCEQLIRLYKVDREECFLRLGDRSMFGIDQTKFINLYPDYSGEYKIPEK